MQTLKSQPWSHRLRQNTKNFRFSASAADQVESAPRTFRKNKDFNILYSDDHLVAIDKPTGITVLLWNYCSAWLHAPTYPNNQFYTDTGLHVHQPEDGFPIPLEENAMKLLKRQLGGTYLYPIHRLDRPTSGKGSSHI